AAGRMPPGVEVVEAPGVALPAVAEAEALPEANPARPDRSTTTPTLRRLADLGPTASRAPRCPRTAHPPPTETALPALRAPPRQRPTARAARRGARAGRGRTCSRRELRRRTASVPRVR